MSLLPLRSGILLALIAISLLATGSVPILPPHATLAHQATPSATMTAEQQEIARLTGIGLEALRSGENERAPDAFQRALRLARQTGDQQSEVVAAIGVGIANDRLGRYADAVTAYQRALAIQQAQGDRFGVETTLASLGSLYLRLSEYDLARAHLEQSLALARARGDVESEARRLNQLGQVAERLGQYGRALETFQQALERAREAGSVPSTASALNNLGVISTRLGRYAEARGHLENGLAIMRALGDRHGEATQLNNLAQVFEMTGDFAEAKSLYEDSLRIRRELGDGPGEAVLLNNLAVIAEKRGEYRQAQELAGQALDAFRQFGDRSSEATVLDTMSIVALDLGRYDDAFDLAQQALQLRRAIGDRAGEGTSLNNLGLVSSARGQSQQAIDQFERALAIHREVGNKVGAGTALNNLGLAHSRLALYELALGYFEDALAIHREIGNRSDEGIALSNKGGAYMNLGQAAQGIALYQQSLDISRTVGDRGGEARGLNNVGFGYAYLGLYLEALGLYEEALDIARAIDDRSVEATALNNIANVYRSLADLEGARERFIQVLTIQRELGDRSGEGIVQNNLGAIEEDQGDFEAAIGRYGDAIAIAREVGNRELEVSGLANLGLLWETRGDCHAALAFYEQAIAAFEQVRSAFRVEELRSSYTEGAAPIYQRAARLQLCLDQPAKSFEVTERGRARVFFEQLTGGQINIGRGANAALVQQEQSLRAQLSSLDRDLQRERARPAAERRIEAIQSLSAELTAMQQQYSQFLTQLKLSDPEYASLTTIEPLGLAEVQDLLDADTTLLSYFLASDFTLVYVITRDGLIAREIPVGDTRLRDIVADRAFAQPRGSLNGLSAISEALLAPVRSALTTRKLGIIPHGVLHYVPFTALTDGDGVLGDSFLLFTLPSASTLPFVESKNRAAPDDGRVLALSPDLESPQFPRLPFANQEVRFVAQTFGIQPEVGPSASEALLKRQSGEVGILHVASHGQYNERNPLFSRLILQDGEGEDGSLVVHEVYGLDLNRARLVVLSACESNLGAQSKGDEVIGLTRAFIFAGAPTVVASLWQVNDRATAVFMGEFYEALQSGAGKADAMRQAQRKVREDYAHPYFWASFVLTGSPD